MQIPKMLCARGFNRVDPRPVRNHAEASFDRRKNEDYWRPIIEKRLADDARKALAGKTLKLVVSCQS